ncbi:hypothetical protein [Roseococcus suduntuyensis]|uniref:ElaB/YqjD/DUF883 family membrane-anchored ribosome-binding protein n=1 Tax=Roseococcus suduntuyensis TaxID=455361 RepID=A0A840AEI3_9PROT|nr:hypothetical protein [Roseococcus suduntuyensis]MBB3898893.1 ElaB/YqjD/DUF883 family membrane-anchored ribosome-binding protein [Roseococcus suduntuyensis]
MSDFRNDPPRVGTAGTTTGSTSFDPHAEITALREKVEALMSERVSPAIGSAVGSAEAAAHRATDAVRHQAENLSDFVHEKPLMAMASAALAGFVFALLVRR